MLKLKKQHFTNYDQLCRSVKAAFEKAPAWDDSCFCKKTGKQKVRRYEYIDLAGELQNGKSLVYPKTPPDNFPKITFKDGSFSTTVFNTKSHIGIFAERIGLSLVETGQVTLPVWTGCSGWGDKPTAKVFPLETDHGLQIYCSSPNPGNRKADYFWLFEGRLLYDGKKYYKSHVEGNSLKNVILDSQSKIGTGILSQELFDFVLKLKEKESKNA